MSRSVFLVCAALAFGSVLALSTGCGGGGSSDASNEVQVYLRNSYPGYVVTSFDMVVSGTPGPGPNLIGAPLPSGETRLVNTVSPDLYDWSAVVEPAGGGMGAVFVRIAEPILDTDEAKVIEIAP